MSGTLLSLMLLLQWGGFFCMPVGVPEMTKQAERPTLTVRTDDPEMTLMLDSMTMPGKGEVRTFNIDHVKPGQWKYKASCIWRDGRQTFHEVAFEGGKSQEVTLNKPKQAGYVRVPDVPPLPPTGVDWEEIEKNHEKVVLHYPGREPEELDRFTAHQLIESGLTDDSHKWFLTYIDADETNRKKFLADVANVPLLAHARDNYHVHAYRPDDPMLAGLNYPLGVLLQDTKGKELAYLSAYAGADALVSSLRKADPNYKPGGSQPALPVSLPGLSTDAMAGLAAVLIIVAVIGGGLWWSRRGAKQ